MRVIAGEAKGHPLKWPRSPHIRPTSDLIREAIFSSLESLPVDWSYILDLYAGTGALGIEALSRGVGKATFVEQNPKCCSLIEENLKHTGFLRKAQIFRLEARKAIHVLKGEYSLIFLDPPYANPGDVILGEIAFSSLVDKESTIVMEHSSRLTLELIYGDFQIVKGIQHGDTSVSIFQFIRREI